MNRLVANVADSFHEGELSLSFNQSLPRIDRPWASPTQDAQRDPKQMESVYVNGGVHTACKQHQRVYFEFVRAHPVWIGPQHPHLVSDSDAEEGGRSGGHLDTQKSAAMKPKDSTLQVQYIVLVGIERERKI